ncbi:MAG: cell division protein FtsQ/DivIB [Holosporales bacterium]|jgi:cell division protein FtsQ|nr:cell division protein FtsQ/DivIB [Holosporales bacterium]
MISRKKRRNRRFLTPWAVKWISSLVGGSLFIGLLAYYDVYHRAYIAWSGSLAEFGFVAENVVVEGCDKVDVNVVRRYLATLQNPCIFASDIDTIRKDLEAFPWVRSAIVQRKLPATLYIRVAERFPIALWQNKHDLQLIDAEGTLLGTEFIEQFAHLPTVIGEGAPQVTAEFLAVLEQFPRLYQRFVSAVWVGGRRWDVFLSDKICVRLPEDNEEDALRFLDTLQKDDGILERSLECIDLRFPGKVITRAKVGASDCGKTLSPAT